MLHSTVCIIELALLKGCYHAYKTETESIILHKIAFCQILRLHNQNRNDR